MATIEKELQSKFKSDQQKAAVNLMFTANQLKAAHGLALRPQGISTEQYNILRILNGSKEEGMKMSDVKSRMIDPSPNTTRLMDRLLEKGAVQRTRSASDRRVVFVSITAKGKELLDQLNRSMSNFFQILENSLTKEEAIQLNQILESFRSSLANGMELACD